MKLKDIAALAGVSVTTASYVINGRAQDRRISPETAQRVLDVAAEYKWQPDAGAAGLRRGQTRSIGFIVPDLENPSYAKLAKRLEQGARAQGYQLLVASSDDIAEHERTLVATLRARRCDGLIVASCLAGDDGVYRQAQDAGLPVVALDRELDADRFVSFVSDDRQAGERLTQALIDPAPPSVAFISAREELPISKWRLAGFRDAIAGYDGDVTVRHTTTFAREYGYEEMRDVLAAGGALPAAILTTSYVLLTGVLDALTEHRSDWTAHTRLATFGEAQLLDFLPGRVDSMGQQHGALASGALDALLRQIEGVPVAPGVRRIERVFKQRRVH
ncbi:catabolite repressor/activator [Schauerella aestuarii]|uniref:catabolite repressor/activator n=1 Tax=Schauerella aestuarii TaxID=2511204 RepID=UPI00136C6DC9|nr:catabolite repressor/activator [Achromobacter aestuarii]MYZ43837.1 catabolite repressor/activator [Achromobacter aestuarii]